MTANETYLAGCYDQLISERSFIALDRYIRRGFASHEFRA